MDEPGSQTDTLNFSAQVLQSELPVLDEIAEEYRERLRVVKVNVEQEPQIALQLGEEN
ncbi:MAG: hypothetical protein KGO02_09730 [Alphaproteobacteria bacterium]|nr:hypothetical protein [Alphaproteobacteria bacterium]